MRVILTPSPVPRLTRGLRAAVCLGRDGRIDELKDHYDRLLEVENRHLPPLVTSIEMWSREVGPTEVLPMVPSPLV